MDGVIVVGSHTADHVSDLPRYCVNRRVLVFYWPERSWLLFLDELQCELADYSGCGQYCPSLDDGFLLVGCMRLSLPE